MNRYTWTSPLFAFLIIMTTYTFCLGVNRYQSIARLDYAERDAHAVHTLFQMCFGFEADYLYESSDGAIINRIKELGKKLRPGDQFIFYFAGHGSSDGTEQYYLLEDYQSSGGGIHPISRTGVLSLSALKNFTAEPAWDCVQKLFIFDACRGHRGRGGGDDGATSFNQNVARNIVYGKKNACPPAKGGLSILNSCDDGMNADESPLLRHGIFTAALLEWLEERALQKKSVEINQPCADELARRMKTLSMSSGTADSVQKPILIGDQISLPVCGKAVYHPIQPSRNALADLNYARARQFHYGFDENVDIGLAEKYYKIAQAFDHKEAVNIAFPLTHAKANDAAQGNAAQQNIHVPQSEEKRVEANKLRSLTSFEEFTDLPDEKFCPRMVGIPAGNYLLSEHGQESDLASRPFRLHRPLAVAIYPVTVAQFGAFFPCHEAFDEKALASQFFAGKLPMTNIDWWAAQEFCKELTKRVNHARKIAQLPLLPTEGRYRLPSDDEWEMFARAGGRLPFSFSPNLAPPFGYSATVHPDWAHFDWRVGHANRQTSSQRPVHPAAVEKFEGNFWKICACHGNVQEWIDCASIGTGETNVRGGYYWSAPKSIRSDSAEKVPLNKKQRGMIGFRVVRTLMDDEWEAV